MSSIKQTPPRVTHSKESEIIAMVEAIAADPTHRFYQHAKEHLKTHATWQQGLGICMDTNKEISMEVLKKNPLMRRSPQVIADAQRNKKVTSNMGNVNRFATTTKR